MTELIKKYGRIAVLFLILASLMLEIMPFAVELRFGVPPEESELGYHAVTYPYFALTPYGYAVFCPLIIFILTCACIVLAVISLFTDSRAVITAEAVICAVCVALAAIWALYALYSFTVAAAVITTLHAIAALALFIARGNSKITTVAVISVLAAAAAFVLSYLVCSAYFAIKLSADANTYFIENIKHMWPLKSAISLAVSAVVGVIPYGIERTLSKNKKD